MTWDDDSSEAKIAIEAMWDGVIDAANDYLVAHPTATSHQIQSALTAIKPVADRRIDLPPNVTALKLRPELFALSFSDDPASIVFVLHPQPGKPQVWRIDHAATQTKDRRGYLRAWQSANAADACRDKEPKGTYGTCGPLNANIGALPNEASSTSFLHRRLLQQRHGCSLSQPDQHLALGRRSRRTSLDRRLQPQRGWRVERYPLPQRRTFNPGKEIPTHIQLVQRLFRADNTAPAPHHT